MKSIATLSFTKLAKKGCNSVTGFESRTKSPVIAIKRKKL